MTVSYDGTSTPKALTIQSTNLSGTVNQNQTSVYVNGLSTPASTTGVQLDDVSSSVLTPPTTQNVATVLTNYTLSGAASSAFSYQSFGPWEYDTSTGGTISWFSYGIPFSAAMPTTGKATYAGIALGNYVDPSGTIYTTTAKMSAAADFGLGTITFNTSSTNTLDLTSNVTAANPALDLSGTLTITGNNFTGSVQNATGTISGNATGLFYGTSTGLTTGSAGGAAVGTPEELGGTYAATGTDGAMMGAFGGKVQ